MPLSIVQGDITALGERVDAIVNAANPALARGGGVCGAIFRVAGADALARELEAYPLGCHTSQCVVTGAGNLDAEAIIHVPGPMWAGGDQHEEDLLSLAYRNILTTLDERGWRSVAIPSLSTGIYGFPLDRAASIATSTIAEHLARCDHDARIVAFDEETFEAYRAAAGSG